MKNKQVDNYYYLLLANDRYYIIEGVPDSGLKWILMAYGERVATFSHKDNRIAMRILHLIGLIDYLSKSAKVRDNTYI